MGDAKGQITPVAAAATQAIHQQRQQRMQPQLRIAEVANAQQLQGPLIHRIKPLTLQRFGIAAK